MADVKKKNRKKRTLLQKIVNVFLYTGIGILALFLIFLGFSQTSTFREILRDKVVAQVNSSMNGTLSIGKIDGTIFTSLDLHNTTVAMGRDTVLDAGVIELKISPLQIFIKKIFVRKLAIKNATVSFVKDSSGGLNVSRLFQSSSSDTTSGGPFPFKIEIASFNLQNVNFYLQRFDNKNSKVNYDLLNPDDLRINDINLALSAYLNPKENNYRLEIDKISMRPNLNNFSLNDLSGKFSIDKKAIEVSGLKIITKKSNISIDASLNNVDIFDSLNSARLGQADVDLDFKADKFNFDDLNSFLASTKILQNNVKVNVKASGKYGDLDLGKIEVNLDSTHLEASGKLKNLNNPKDLYIAADFRNSVVHQADVDKLLPSLKIPLYKKYGDLRFDTLRYAGEPLDFRADVYLKTNHGGFGSRLVMNLKKHVPSYDLKFVTKSFDLSPLAGITSKMNSNGTITGSGFSPENMNSSINLRADGSVIGGNKIDTLHLSADAAGKKINYSLNLKGDTTKAFLSGLVNFTVKDTPSYKLNGYFNNLNLYKFTGDTTLKSDLNFTINAEGKNFNIDNSSLYASLSIHNSVLRNFLIDSTRAIVDIRREQDKRVINFISDLADITVTGNFELVPSIDLISKEIGLVVKTLDKKINQIVKNQPVFDKQLKVGLAVPVSAKKIKTKTRTHSDLNFAVEFKDFSLLSVLIGDNIEIDGDIGGQIKSTADSVSIAINTNLNYVKFWGKKEVFFLSKMVMNLNLDNSLLMDNLAGLNAGLKIKTDRVFRGSDIYDLTADLKLNRDSADFNFSGRLEKYLSAKIKGAADLSKNDLNLGIDSLDFSYNNFHAHNKSAAFISYSKDSINIRNFVLVRNNSELKIDGSLLRSGNQNLSIDINNLRGKDLSANFFGLKKSNSLTARLGLNTKITGDFARPVIDMKFTVDSVSFKNKNFGKLESNINYKDKLLKADVVFVDSMINKSQPALQMQGHMPVDLSFTGVNDRFVKSKDVNLKLTAAGFNLAALGDILPKVQKLRGLLKADLTLTGNYNDLKPAGYVTLNEGGFLLDANNLDYDAGFKLEVSKNKLTIDSLKVANVPGTINGGYVRGNGNITLDNFAIKSSEISLNGQLKVLGQSSKSVSPTVYGDLVIATNGDLNLTAGPDGGSLKAPIIVKEANITYAPVQTGYENTSDNFIYRFVEDTINNKNKGMDFESLVNLAEQRSNLLNNNVKKKYPFDYNIDVTVENEATLVFVLSKEINQNLTAILKGNFQYEVVNGRTNAQGELTLLDGSNLEFIKTFEASGSIRFESELSNPYLDITATYKDYYYPPDPNASEVQVAVKIHLKGPLKELDKNFVQEKNNIAVYYGADNIANNVPDNAYDASDAILFVLTGKFNKDLATSSSSNDNPFQNSATSIVGSFLGGVLHSYLGDYVRSVELRSTGANTKFNLAGRVKDFRYTIGGSTDVFQDISQASVKIEYPIFKSLIIRLERKQAITETSLSTEMINELALKYRFEF